MSVAPIVPVFAAVMELSLEIIAGSAGLQLVADTVGSRDDEMASACPVFLLFLFQLTSFRCFGKTCLAAWTMIGIRSAGSVASPCAVRLVCLSVCAYLPLSLRLSPPPAELTARYFPSLLRTPKFSRRLSHVLSSALDSHSYPRRLDSAVHPSSGQRRLFRSSSTSRRSTRLRNLAHSISKIAPRT